MSVGSSFPAIPGNVKQCEPGDVSWNCGGIVGSRRRFPDIRRRQSKDVCKPARVNSQLAALDAQQGSPSSSNSTLQGNPGPRRAVAYGIQASAEHVSKLCEKGQLREAVDGLGVLVQTGLRVPTSLFYRVLKSCVAQKNLNLGRRVHELTAKAGYESNTFLANHILRMYASHGRLQEAMDVFTKVPKPDAFSWSAAIAALAKHEEPKQAIGLYQKMRSSSVKPDCHVFVAALQACARAAELESGRQVHADLLKSGVQPDLFVWNSLLDMYIKCGRLGDARTIFDSLVTKDVVTWTTMVAGYAEHERGQEVLSLYEQMGVEDVVLADPITFVCLLKACANAGALRQGKQLHSQILEKGLEANVMVSTCVIDMYAKCGRLEDARQVFDGLATKDVVTCNTMIAGYTKCGRVEEARRVFDRSHMKDVVTWTTIIGGYAEQGLCQEALVLFHRMEQEGLIRANPVTFACLLRACATVGALQQGKQLHSQILKRGLEADLVVGTCLVDMYVKCGELKEARKVFDGVTKKDVVTWTTMIAGYAELGVGQEALALYEEMEQKGLILADSFTFACLLKACAIVGALQQGRQLHSQIVEREILFTDIFVANSLVDMYAKCGRLDDACNVFDSLPTKDVVTWNAMINGFGQSNEGLKAVECFRKMVQDGIQADHTTFTCLLAACSHAGLVEEGQQIFKAMVETFAIIPNTDHYNCMVDLLGRAGYLEEAEKTLSYERNDVGSRSLLYACRIHGDIERAKRCFTKLTSSDSQNASAYVLMGNIYADAGRWLDVERIGRMRRAAGASKKAAVAGIEVERHVHTFVVGEERGDISTKVRSTNSRLKEEGGRVPRTELVLKRLSENDKEDELCGHAEKLALAYGLLNTPDGAPLLVTKNLRMCGDCHSSTEVMSRIECREIIVRDAHRVHRFVDGSCRCGGRP